MLHTDIPTRAELEVLLRSREPASVSIYVPTTPVTVDVDGSRIELKNLASTAAAQLDEAGHDKRDVAAISEELAALDDDPDFWAHQAHSLAVFATPSHLSTFRLPNRLAALVEVSDRFHCKPLLRAVTFPQAAFVLAIAGGSVRLLEVSPDLPPYEVRVQEMPTDVASAVGKSSIKDRSETGRLQGAEGQKVRLTQYARQVDAAIRPMLSGLHIPLILAATEPIDAIFRSVSSYPHLADTSIAGNPETTSDADLAAKARIVLDDWYAADLATVRERFELRSSQGRASTDIVDVARAATFGAVESVFVDIDEVVPGFVDEESGAVTFTESDSSDDYGVVDEIARRAFLTGARVLAVRRDDIPANGTVAAILRFAI